MVRTWRQTPRFCGAPGIDTWRWRRLFQFLRMAGALIFEILRLRPWRTSWLIVGTKTLLLEVGRLIHPVVADRPVPGVGAAGGGRRTGCVGGFERWVTAHAPRADPSRGHEGGVYQRPDERVKRAAGRRWVIRRGLGSDLLGGLFELRGVLQERVDGCLGRAVRAVLGGERIGRVVVVATPARD